MLWVLLLFVEENMSVCDYCPEFLESLRLGSQIAEASKEIVFLIL